MGLPPDHESESFMPCCSAEDCASTAERSARFRRVLWIALVINARLEAVPILR